MSKIQFLLSQITTEELEKAISNLKTNKSPGSDGYTAEWYKSFKELISPPLLKTFNWILTGGEIPPSWREAVIAVIPKEGKDRLDCSNYRPISVLNQDYKLFTSILAKRLELILPDIVNLDQTGFIKERQTRDNIRRTLHVMNHIKKNNVEAVILGLDAEKAFDSVDWSFLYRVLHTFNFHEQFVKTIEALYNKPTAKIRINGTLSNSFQLQRGCRQGCPMSPLLFAVFIEPLSQWIRQNKDIQGIKMAQTEQKIALFADDILLYIGSPTSSLPALINTLTDFGSLSGYRLNTHKCQVLTFNYTPDQDIRETLKIKWDSEMMRYLGINIPKNFDTILALNHDSLISKIKADLFRWNLIPFLSLAQRVEAVKMNILPRLLYLFQTIPIECGMARLQELDKMISRFVWGGKKPRIKFRTLQISTDNGGLSLPNFKNYLRAAQIKTLIDM